MRSRLTLYLAGCLLLTATLTCAAEPLCGRVETLGSDPNAITVLYLWGTPYEQGYAHGKLCAERVKQMIQLLNFGACVAMGVGPEKLDAAWAAMAPYVPGRYKEELRGLADGAGISLPLVQRAHAIPELSEFHCTFFGAWGKATRDGHLHQIRALDYATQAGLQDRPALIVSRPAGGVPFVNVGWVGFIGCVSGMNAAHIAVSEIGENFGPDHETLAGEPMCFLLRDVLERATTLDQAVNLVRAAPRTSSYLYCLGDGKIPAARALRTAKDFCEVYDPATYPGQRLADVVYWSMGDDSKWNPRVYNVLQTQWGQIDQTTGMRDVMRGLGTGNLHAVAYDATALKLWVANASPGPQVVPAYRREFWQFNLARALRHQGW